jgi:hypothetical protein
MRGAKSNALFLRRINWNRVCPCVALVIRPAFGRTSACVRQALVSARPTHGYDCSGRATRLDGKPRRKDDGVPRSFPSAVAVPSLTKKREQRYCRQMHVGLDTGGNDLWVGLWMGSGKNSKIFPIYPG